MKKNENENCQPTLEEKYAALKKTNAGIRGQMGLQAKRIKDLKKRIDELLDEREAKNRTIAGLESQVIRLQEIVNEKTSEYNFLQNSHSTLQGSVNAYNQKPWYEKIFCFNI